VSSSLSVRRPPLPQWWGRTRAFAESGNRLAMAARRTLGALLAFVVIRAAFGLSPVDIVNGLSVGALYGIIGVALVLSYKTSRVINFAAAAVGAVPAIVAVSLTIADGVSYAITLPIAVLGGLLFGALTEVLVLRRFAKTSRLIVTVVTIGIAQSFAALGFFIPVWFGQRAAQAPKVTTPWQQFAYHNSRGQPVVTGNDVFAIGSVVVLTIALALFLKRSRFGIALRASSENGERAALLGIPVARVATIAWAIAGLLSGMAIFGQAPLIGLPSDATLGFDTLLYGLAAAVVARMESVGLALLTGLGIGLLIAGSVTKTGTNDYASALMIVVILLGLLAQRRTRSRAVESGASTWQAITVFRPIPVELRRLPEVVRARGIGYLAAVGLAVVLPYLVTSSGNLFDLSVVVIYGIIAVSLVILTGWAGQISLGQFGIVGMAAAVAGGIAAKHNIDFFAALSIGIAVGAATAVVIGLPAVRIHGLYLAVTTLAFGYAVQNYILNQNYFIGSHILPSQDYASLRRPMLYGKFNLEDPRVFYFVCLAFLLLSLLGAMSFRRHHSGRLLIALRDNQRAATSYSIAPVRSRLAAFAISGVFCGVAGVLFAYLQHQVIPGTFAVQASIGVFLAAAVGGLGSLGGGVLGVIGFEATVLFGPLAWQHLGNTIDQVMPLLLTGPLLILNLWANPGGLAGWAFQLRDDWLRKLAARHQLRVPALVADRRPEDGPPAEIDIPEAATAAARAGSLT
jgi:branched-chain amino acid transport system permease protein